MSKGYGKQKLVRDISANTLQAGATQLFGLLIFYFTSKYLAKDDFGDFNWCMAVGATVLAVASLGLDLIYVKKISVGENKPVISGLHYFHTLIVGVVLSSLAFAVHLFVPSFNHENPLFFLIFVNLDLANVANSFKLCLNGLESYRKLAVLAVSANTFKLLLIVLLYLTGRFSMLNVIMAYTATSALEYLMGYFFISGAFSASVRPVLRPLEYKYFILEALPQLGVVLFDSALARIDWILLGILSTAAATAEYSFVYKIFELSKLPLLIIAPVLLTRFSKLFKDASVIGDTHRKEIFFFFKLEMFLIMLIPIALVCTWSPLIDFFTANKYGKVNEINYTILAICVPLHAAINFLWTLGFVQGQLKTILYITILVSVLNIVANVIFIPFFQARGAAVAFLICTLLQLGFYLRYIDQSKLRANLPSLLLFLCAAAVSVLIGKLCFTNIFLSASLAIAVYCCLAFFAGGISLKNIKGVISPAQLPDT
jgi:O-antigen/teichoic acid export membrane protein